MEKERKKEEEKIRNDEAKSKDINEQGMAGIRSEAKRDIEERKWNKPTG